MATLLHSKYRLTPTEDYLSSLQEEHIVIKKEEKILFETFIPLRHQEALLRI